jgi:hypothetical protein
MTTSIPAGCYLVTVVGAYWKILKNFLPKGALGAGCFLLTSSNPGG